MRKLLLIILLGAIIIPTKLYSQDIKIGFSNSTNFISSTVSSSISSDVFLSLSNNRRDIKLMAGPTIEIFENKGNKFSVNTSLTVNEQGYLGVPFFLNYYIDNHRSNSIGIGMYVYNGKYNLTRYHERKTDFFLGCKYSKTWLLKDQEIKTNIMYGFDLKTHNMNEFYTADRFNFDFKFMMVSASLAFIFEL